MKVIDAHTHFKEKFLKVLTEQDKKDYLDSGVEHMIGVVDFFPIRWEEIIKEASILLSCFIKAEYKVNLERRVIENLLWEEIDYSKKEINNKGFYRKLCNKVSCKNKAELSAFGKAVNKILNFSLPVDNADRFIKNIEEEIAASRLIHNRYGIKSYLCAGIHPLAISHIGDFKDLRRVLNRVEALLKKSKHVIGIGECGIENNNEIEKNVLYEMLVLGKKLKVPVVMHTPLTHGKIPAARKLKGISDMCKIVKRSGIDVSQIAFDHITDAECVELIEKEFAVRKPYLSFSIQEHWISAEEAASVIKKIQPNWADNIMVNSDFGTYQTPKAFSLLRQHMNDYDIPQELIEKVLYINPLRFFNLAGMGEKPNNAPTKKNVLAIDIAGIKNSLDILFSLTRIKDWLLPAYDFKEIVLISPNSTKLIQSYLEFFGNKNIRILPSYRQREKAVILKITPKTDFAYIYDEIEKKMQ